MTVGKTFLLLDTAITNAQQTCNAELRLRPATKDPASPMFGEEFFADPPRRWEARYDNGYPHVFWDDSIGRFRLYYTVFIIDEASARVLPHERPSAEYHPGPERTAALCYAESGDGIRWTKPELGMVEFEGSTANNIIMRNAHGTSVILDRNDPEPGRRYKLITKMEYSSSHHFMAVAFSADGVHFSEPTRWPRFNPRADTHNFAYWDERRQEFGLITRLWSGRLRVAAKSRSTDFVSWDEPTEVFRGRGFREQVYSMPVIPFAQGYLGFPAMFHEGDRAAADFDLVDTRLAFSADSEHWELVCPGEAMISRGAGQYPGGEFDNSCIYAAAPIEIDDRMALYYIGSNGRHTGFREGALGRAWIEKDKFAFYQGVDPTRDSILVTAPFSVYGDVELLVEREESGTVDVELRAGSWPIPGFGRDDCALIKGNDDWVLLRFGNRHPDALAGQPISFWIRSRGVRVFALRGGLEPIPRA